MGGLDGLVLNVGTGAGLGIGGTTPEDWDRVMAVNLRSAFLGCKYGLERMDDGGAIVITGSVASSQVMPIPAYGASKAALDSLCRQAAVEAAPRLRVNQVVPGLIDTSLGRLASAISPRRDQVKIPLGRQGTAWEVAAAAPVPALRRRGVCDRSAADRRRRPYDRTASMSTEPRIPPIDPADADDDVRGILAFEPPGLGSKLGDNNIFATLAGHPDLFKAWLPFGGCPADRELAVRLAIARSSSCGSPSTAVAPTSGVSTSRSRRWSG